MEYHAFADEKGRREVFVILADNIDEMPDDVLRKSWGLIDCPVIITDGSEVWKQIGLLEVEKIGPLGDIT